MFFVLSKLLDIFMDPFWWCFGSLAVGLGLLVRGTRRSLSFVLCTFGLGAFFLLSLPAVSNRLWHSLEAGVTSTQKAGVTYDAVVLLGGIVSPQGSLRDEPAFNDNIERLLTVRRLLLSGQAKVAILSGGALGGPLRSEADYEARELIAQGVPEAQLVIEDKANNTRDNATLSRALLEKLGAKSVLLVTSAFHMPRAAGCFRAVGIEGDLLPVDYRHRDADTDSHVLPRGEYFAQSTSAIREWFGRLVYRVMGYTK